MRSILAADCGIVAGIEAAWHPLQQLIRIKINAVRM
jgi:hypothetical protein